jgi:hypothetical protein
MGRELRGVEKRLCAWVVSMWLGIRRPKTAEGGWERKESFRLGGCIERAGLVP